MKRLFLNLSLVLLGLSVMVPPVNAKRLGGGGSMGMKRAVPPAVAPKNSSADQPAAAPNAPNAPNAAPAPAAPAAKRSWMGPLAGLAAGLGLAALMNHFGLGGAFSSLIMMVLIGVAAFMLIRFLMRRFAPQNAAQGFQFAGASSVNNQPRPWGSGVAPIAPVSLVEPLINSIILPKGFDLPAFERTAKLLFIRLQAANDAGHLNDLRTFTTPEMFAAVKLELQERGHQKQQTDVVNINAELLNVTQEATQQVASVRFYGMIKEETNMPAAAFDEIWYMVKAVEIDSEWVIGGIGTKIQTQ
jgi:predicted lipid-binding transport protein (Tim44 family)